MSVQVKGSGTIGGLDEGLVVSGIVTSSTQINVGSNIKLGNAGVITATSFVGNITGTATQVSLASQSTDTDCYPVFSLNATGNQALYTKSNRLSFNSATGALSATSFVGAVSGTTGTFTGDVDIADTIVHTGDTNTKIRFPSADNISFEVAGTERLRIDNVDGVVAKHTTAANLRVQNSTAATGQVAQLDLAPANGLSGVQLRANSEEDFSTGANRTAFFSAHVRKDGTFYERLRIASDGTLTVGDGNNLAADYVATMLIDGGDNSKLTLYSSSTGSGTIAFADGSSTGAQRMAGFIQMSHTSSDNGPRLLIGQNDLSMLHIRSPGSNRGQLEVYGNFNESDTPAIEISDGGDARKAFITNSSGDLNLLTRNGSQTKGQLKMFESGVFFHAQKDPDSTNVLQTFRAQTYRNQTGSTNPSISPDQRLIQKGGSGTYDCFYEGNMTLTVNGGGNDHYQPVAFVPLGYDLDTSSFGGQWAGEMWMHQTGSQNPTNYGYSGYNTWATMTFKCKWDCAHWNAKPNGFWVEHYLNTGRAQIGKIDAATTMSQFVIYLLPGYYHIRYNCVRGMAVHRSSSNGGSITLRDGGSMATYSTLAYSSRNTAFDSEITSGSASMTHST